MLFGCLTNLYYISRLTREELQAQKELEERGPPEESTEPSLVEQARSLIESEPKTPEKRYDVVEEQKKSDNAVQGALTYGIPATLNGGNENV